MGRVRSRKEEGEVQPGDTAVGVGLRHAKQARQHASCSTVEPATSIAAVLQITAIQPLALPPAARTEPRKRLGSEEGRCSVVGG